MMNTRKIRQIKVISQQKASDFLKREEGNVGGRNALLMSSAIAGAWLANLLLAGVATACTDCKYVYTWVNSKCERWCVFEEKANICGEQNKPCPGFSGVVSNSFCGK